MSVGEIVDIVLSILSFLLAAISVVTVIITLKQNKKISIHLQRMNTLFCRDIVLKRS